MHDSFTDRPIKPEAGRKERITAAIERFLNRVHEGGSGLWDHQSSAMSSVGAFLADSVEQISEGKRASGAIVMPTGAGKTRIAAEVTKALGLRTIVLAPTIDIAMQDLDELKEFSGLPVSLYYGAVKDLSGQVIVMTYQSAVALMKDGPLPFPVDIVFHDEAHLSMSEKRSELHGLLGAIDIGLTATPAYKESRHIWNVFEVPIYEMSLQEGIETGILSPLRGFIVETSLDLKGVELKSKQGLLDEQAAERYLNVLARNRAARDFYLDGFRGMPAVTFCVSKRHSEEFASYMQEAGIKSAYIHGSVDPKRRKELLEAFENGDLDLLTTPRVLIHGWDSKRVVVGLNLAPTFSYVIKTQSVGRLLRAAEGKPHAVFAEFQDIYERGQQPVLVHHLFEELTYRQGGLIAAPKARREEEEEQIRRKEKVKISGSMHVSYSVQEVVKLDKRESTLYDTATVRRILLSRPDLDFARLNLSSFRSIRFEHPEFRGTGERLIKAWSGGASTVEDYERMLWLALEKEMTASKPGPRFREDIIGLSFGVPEPKVLEVMANTALAQKLARLITLLNPRDRALIDGVTQGKNDTSIAVELGLPVHRVHALKQTIFDRLMRDLEHGPLNDKKSEKLEAMLKACKAEGEAKGILYQYSILDADRLLSVSKDARFPFYVREPVYARALSLYADYERYDLIALHYESHPLNASIPLEFIHELPISDQLALVIDDSADLHVREIIGSMVVSAMKAKRAKSPWEYPSIVDNLFYLHLNQLYTNDKTPQVVKAKAMDAMREEAEAAISGDDTTRILSAVFSKCLPDEIRVDAGRRAIGICSRTEEKPYTLTGLKTLTILARSELTPAEVKEESKRVQASAESELLAAFSSKGRFPQILRFAISDDRSEEIRNSATEKFIELIRAKKSEYGSQFNVWLYAFNRQIPRTSSNLWGYNCIPDNELEGKVSPAQAAFIRKVREFFV